MKITDDFYTKSHTSTNFNYLCSLSEQGHHESSIIRKLGKQDVSIPSLLYVSAVQTADQKIVLDAGSLCLHMLTDYHFPKELKSIREM